MQQKNSYSNIFGVLIIIDMIISMCPCKAAVRQLDEGAKKVENVKYTLVNVRCTMVKERLVMKRRMYPGKQEMCHGKCRMCHGKGQTGYEMKDVPW